MKLSIKKQFTLVISLFVFLAVVLVSVFIFYRVNIEITDRTCQIFDNTLQECVRDVDDLIGKIQKLNDSISINERLFEAINFQSDDVIRQLDAVSQIKLEYNNLSYLLLNNMSEGNGCRFVFNAKYPVTANLSGIDDSRLFEAESALIYKNSNTDNIWNQIDLQNLTILPLDENDGYAVFAQEIYDNVRFSGDTLGINLVRVNLKQLLEKYVKRIGGGSVRLAVINSDNQIFYRDSSLDAAKAIHYFSECNQNGLKTIIEENGKNYSVGVYPIALGVNLIALVDRELVQIEVKHIAWEIALISFTVLLTLLIIAVTLLDKLTRPVRELSDVMMKFDENTTVGLKEEDFRILEVQRLYYCFNQMVNRIQELLKEASLRGQKEKEMEMKILESQINPHFLYNSLDAIAWIALIRKENDIVDMISALSDGFRYSIKNTEKAISVRDEIDFIVNYLHLQELRYKGKFFFHLDIDEEAKALLIPKFLIQPLVENSITYGLNGHDGEIKITLSAKIKNDELVICVKDDGPGFDADKLNRYLDGETRIFSDEKIGIHNVNERIKMKFGNHFGLRYSMEEGELTAEIRVPVIEQKSDE